MKTLLLSLLTLISISGFAQSTILSQNFSSSNMIDDYVSSTPNLGQFNTITSTVSNYPADEFNNQVAQYPGEASKSITDSKLKFTLMSPLAIQRTNQGYFVAYMREATGGFSRIRGSVDIAKIQFKFNSNISSEGVDPKTGYLIFNYGSFGTLGQNGSNGFTINGIEFTGEHTITILANFSTEDKNYSTPSTGSLPPQTYDVFVDGSLVTENSILASTTNPDVSIEVKSSYAYQGYPGVGPYHGAQFEVTFDDILIQDLSGVLPVTLTKFTANPFENGSILLKWTTTAETNSDYFVIEHSRNSRQWKVIAKTPARGESNELANYDYTHTSPLAGNNLYRLKQTDKDGTFTYSRIISANLNNNELSLLYPNPASDRVFIKDLHNAVKVEILSLSGTAVLERSKNLAEGIELQNVTSGMYLVRVQDKNGAYSTAKIVVKK